MGHGYPRFGQRPHCHQPGPVKLLKGDAVNSPTRCDDPAPDRKSARRAQNAVTDHTGRNGCAADDIGNTGLAQPGSGGGGQIIPGKAANIGGDIGIGYAQGQHGFIVLHHLRPGDPPLGRNRHQDIQGAARIAHRPGHLPGRGQITDDLALCRCIPTRHARLLARQNQRARQAQQTRGKVWCGVTGADRGKASRVCVQRLRRHRAKQRKDKRKQNKTSHHSPQRFCPKPAPRIGFAP